MSPDRRVAADAAICSRIRTLPEFRAARVVALYFAFDGEPDLSPILGTDQPKTFCVPVISGGRMYFAMLGPGTVLQPNEYGIAEPYPPDLVEPRSLDLVLTPMVAFDSAGNRLGMGAGYYDRCFAFLRHRRAWFRPKLLGAAYDLQEVDALQANPWDVPLRGIVTETGHRRFDPQ